MKIYVSTDGWMRARRTIPVRTLRLLSFGSAAYTDKRRKGLIGTFNHLSANLERWAGRNGQRKATGQTAESQDGEWWAPTTTAPEGLGRVPGKKLEIAPRQKTKKTKKMNEKKKKQEKQKLKTSHCAANVPLGWLKKQKKKKVAQSQAPFQKSKAKKRCSTNKKQNKKKKKKKTPFLPFPGSTSKNFKLQYSLSKKKTKKSTKQKKQQPLSFTPPFPFLSKTHKKQNQTKKKDKQKKAEKKSPSPSKKIKKRAPNKKKKKQKKKKKPKKNNPFPLFFPFPLANVLLAFGHQKRLTRKKQSKKKPFPPSSIQKFTSPLFPS